MKAVAEKQTRPQSGTLSFYTLCPEFTNLLRMFIGEGNFLKVYTILKDGGLPEGAIKLFFLYKICFKGDSRTEKGLFTGKETKKHNLKEIYTTAIATCLKQDGFEPFEWKNALRGAKKEAMQERQEKYSEDFYCLNQIFTIEEIRDLAAVNILARIGYKPKTNPLGKFEGNGVVLRDGSYITCGYQGHADLYPVLFQLDLSSSDWTDDDMIIHVSSGNTCGKTAFNISRSEQP